MVFKAEKYLSVPHVDLLSYLFDNPTYNEHKDIYVDAADDSRRLSAFQSLSYIRKLIAGFKAHNVRDGDCICLHSFNDHILCSMAYLGIIGSGGCFVGSNPSYTALELYHLFSTSGTKIILVEPQLLQNILPAAQMSGISHSNIFIFNVHGQKVPDGFQSWDILLDHGESDWDRFDDEYRAKTTTAALFSTSGTSGLPKMAVISHYAQIATNVQAYDSIDKPYEVSRLLCLPQFHAFCVPLAHTAPLREGHTTYIMRRFELEKFFDAAEKFKITETAIVPPILMAMVNSQYETAEKISSLRFILCAGAPLNAALQKRFRNLLSPQALVVQNWGLTEASWVTSFMYPESDTTGSVGRLLPNMEAKLMDEHGLEIIDDFCRGEVYIRGPSLMSCYLSNPEATEEAFCSGWLRSGDIAYVRDGKWFIVDRVKDMIKVRGWQVAPSELEAALLTHPHITDAAVIGITLSGSINELPRAYVVLDSFLQAKVSEEDVKDYLLCLLARYKALDGGVKFVSSIPKSPSGKILKRFLREEARRELMVGIEVDEAKQNNTVDGVNDLMTRREEEDNIPIFGKDASTIKCE